MTTSKTLTALASLAALTLGLCAATAHAGAGAIRAQHAWVRWLPNKTTVVVPQGSTVTCSPSPCE